MQTSFRCFSPNAYSQQSNAFNSWGLWRSGHRHTRQYITCGKPFLWRIWMRPSVPRGSVTHCDGWSGFESAFSSSSKAPFFFLSFLDRYAIAISAHFSSSSPCFHPRSLFTAGWVNENKEDMLAIFQRYKRLPNKISCSLQFAENTIVYPLLPVSHSHILWYCLLTKGETTMSSVQTNAASLDRFPFFPSDSDRQVTSRWLVEIDGRGGRDVKIRTVYTCSLGNWESNQRNPLICSNLLKIVSRNRKLKGPRRGWGWGEL